MRVERAASKVQTLGMVGTKWDFFVAAINLFSARGYSSVSIRDIAKMLNIKAASMYNHFENKDALLQQIYEFCRVNHEVALPDLDGLMELIPTTPPREILKKFSLPFVGKAKKIMPKTMQIVLDEMDRDERAAKLVKEIFVEVPNRYVRAMLVRMIELDVIEPMDIDAFLTLRASFNIYAVHTARSKYAISQEDWLAGHELLLGLVKPKKK